MVTTQATLCFIVHEGRRKVLLGLKQRGFGEGKYNGFGGKIEPGETPQEAVVREVWEEAGVRIDPTKLRSAGEIAFRFPAHPAFDHFVHVFVTTSWIGEPRNSEEMHPKWFAADAMPYKQMWQDDAHWLPLVLDGVYIEAEFTFADDNETVADYSLRQVGAQRDCPAA